MHRAAVILVFWNARCTREPPQIKRFAENTAPSPLDKVLPPGEKLLRVCPVSGWVVDTKCRSAVNRAVVRRAAIRLGGFEPFGDYVQWCWENSCMCGRLEVLQCREKNTHNEQPVASKRRDSLVANRLVVTLCLFFDSTVTDAR